MSWSDLEIVKLKELYPDTKSITIANLLSKSLSQVRKKAYKIGLKKNDTFFRDCSLNEITINPKMRATLYQKGRTNENKGKKLDEFMSEKQKQKFLSNSFKKGNVSHNTKFDGYEYTDKNGDVVVRLSSCNYISKQRYLYIKNIGEVPKNMFVTFKDGDKTNFNLGNLICISNAELMYRNSVHNYPLEIVPTLAKINLINKKIKHLKNDR